MVGGPPNVGFVSQAEYLLSQGHEVRLLLEETYPNTEASGTGPWSGLYRSAATKTRHPWSAKPGRRWVGKVRRRLAQAGDIVVGLPGLVRLWTQSRRTTHDLSSSLAGLALTSWTTRQVRHLVPAPDVVHVQDGGPARRVAAALDLYGLSKPTLVVSFLGMDLLACRADERGERFSGTVARADALTVATRFMRSALLDAGALESKVHVIPNTIDPRQCPRRERRLAEDGIARLVSVGRLIDLKGFRYSILATKELLDRGRRVHLSVLGSGPLENELKDLAEHLGIATNIDFLGHLPQARTYAHMATRDILVHPGLDVGGRAEAMGLVSPEAQQIGLHVVATDAGGLPETVVPGVSGVLVAQRDPMAIADAVERLLEESDEELDRRIAAGVEHVKNNFTIDSQGSRLLSLY